MKKLKLNSSKGFTLVECIIAIAVFAIMTSMVLMIMASTVKMSKKASESEAGLNQLVQNVVQDSSNKTYWNPTTHAKSADSKTLEMAFSGAYSADFAISYSTVDGARNMFRCPSCGYEANNNEFFAYLYTNAAYTGAEDDDKKNFKISHWFDPNTPGRDYYECPQCLAKTYVSSVDYKCISCERTGAANTFNYDNINGGYSCPACNSGKVVELDATSGLPINQDMVNSNNDFKVSSIQSNAIRYASIEEPDAAKRAAFMSLTSPSADGFNFNLSYTPSTTPQAAGIYTLTISSFTNLNDGDISSVSITLPGAYKCTLLPLSGTTCNITDFVYDATDGVTASVSDSVDFKDTSEYSTLNFTNIKHNQSYVVKFTLTNYKNNQSFEDDYDSEGGLMKFWYGSSGSSINYTVPPPEPSTP